MHIEAAQDQGYRMRSRVPEVANQDQEESKLYSSIQDDDASNLNLRCEQSFENLLIARAFTPRKSNKLDEQIAKVLKEHNFTLPVANIRAGLYLIGTSRCNCDIKYSAVMVKVGGGWMKLEDYLKKNEQSMHTTLTEHVVRSGKPLDWIVE